MEIEPIEDILRNEGVGIPTLNVLMPNVDNYSTLLMQPCGNIEVNDQGVRSIDRALATVQFSQFLSNAVEAQADLVITPEYAMPWNVLLESLKGDIRPSPGKLWVLGCESLKLAELEGIKTEISPYATLIFESLEMDNEKFLGPLVYVFIAPALANEEESKLVILCQFKTNPMGDADHFEVNRLMRGSKVYQFGNTKGQEIKLITLICSDAFNFLDHHASETYDRGLVIHIQLNPKPRHEQFRLYRGKLFGFSGDETELICLNWASNVQLRINERDFPWKNIAGSAWYLKSVKFDYRDEILSVNHKRGLYYTRLNELCVHALFFNYVPATYLINATKVAHIGVIGSLSRRRGPQLIESRLWSTDTQSWSEKEKLEDGFSGIIGIAGNASANIRDIHDKNPFIAERILAICSGKVGVNTDWHSVTQLDSCVIDSREIIFRVTFCQDSEPKASDFRTSRLRRCCHLWTILQDVPKLPTALTDFASGFKFDWIAKSPNQNAISEKGKRATVVYMGEDVTTEQVDAVKKILEEHLHRGFSDPNKSIEARQRLTVWYRDDSSEPVVHKPYTYSQIDMTGDRSAVDIGRVE